MVSKNEENRENNSIIKLAQPYGVFHTENYEDDLAVIIKNEGLGPLIIRDFVIYQGDDEYRYQDLYECLSPFGDSNIEWSTFRTTLPGS